jgi:protease I
MRANVARGRPVKGRIGVLIEDHFDQTEFRMFNEYFPGQGYEVEYLTHLWGLPELHFDGNPDNGVIEERVTVSAEVERADPRDYQAVICIGAYAMDRLRYQSNPQPGQPNQAPAVAFLRRALSAPDVRVGAICHGLWLFCADPALIRGRRVTCAHNIICDVENAGGEVVYEAEGGTAELVIDGNLVTAKHPEATQRFMEVLVGEIERSLSRVGVPGPQVQEGALP